MQIQDEIFMARALQLAQMGEKTTAPNPMVGAVIVHNNSIIGEGYHQQYGEAHAEVNAINTVTDQSLLNEATIYVTLEPCAHFGKTPPCSDLIVKHQFKRVVICNQDPFNKVNGLGIKKIQNAGITIETDLLKEQGLRLNRRFFTFHQQKRPYIILKWAETKDGFIYSDAQKNNWISNSIAKQLVHEWRAAEGAILVGKNTVMADNPELTTREVKGSNPIRIVIDKNLEIPINKNVFNEASFTFVLNEQKQLKVNQTLNYKKTPLGNNLSKAVCELCYQENIQSIIIEGGQQILSHFIKNKVWDEARIFKGDQLFKTGVEAPKIKGKLLTQSTILNNQLNILVNRYT